MSCVMRPKSHVTFHMSHVLVQISHFTYHLPPANNTKNPNNIHSLVTPKSLVVKGGQDPKISHIIKQQKLCDCMPI